jgi:hypothetical protein
MKNTTLLLLILFGFGLANSFGQSTRSIDKNEWLIGVGFNTINSQGSKSPVGDISDWAFRYPLAVSAETYWSRLFSVELAASLNGYKAGDDIDAVGPSDDNLTYFAIDTHLKYYFGEKIFPRTEWIDFYAMAGLGFFTVEDGNLSGNIGGGAMFWLDKKQSKGIKLQGVAKLAFNHSNSGSTYANNHFQYNLMFVFRLY